MSMFEPIQEDPPTTLDIRCIGCNKSPEDIPEYQEMATDDWGYESATEAVQHEEGTFNPANGHFTCTSCYIRIGAPSSPDGWVAP